MASLEGDEGVSHSRVNSPRLAATMTRRGQSFKRGINGGVPEIELQINSPRSSSENPGSPVADGEVGAGIKLGQHGFLRFRLTVPQLPGKGIFKKSEEAGFTPRERRKLRNFMFWCFCLFCLVLGLPKMFSARFVRFSVNDQVGFSICPSLVIMTVKLWQKV